MKISFGISAAAADIPVFIRIVRIEIFPIVKPVESQVIIFRNHGRFMVLFTINLNRKTRLHEDPIIEGAIIHRLGALTPCGTLDLQGKSQGSALRLRLPVWGNAALPHRKEGDEK